VPDNENKRVAINDITSVATLDVGGATGTGIDGTDDLAVKDDALIEGELITKAGPVYNVKAYGADPSESAANNATYIQAAIDAASTATGGTVYIPVGTYSYDTGLTLPAGVNLEGAGRDEEGGTTGTQLSYTGSGVALTIATKGHVIEKLRISGTSSAAGGVLLGSGTATATHISFYQVWISGFNKNSAPYGYGMKLNGVVYVDAIASRISACYDGLTQTSWSDTHDGGNNEATVMTDSGASFTVDELIGKTIYNKTDGSSGAVTDNDGTTVTVASLTGGTDNDWDTSDVYFIGVNNTTTHFYRCSFTQNTRNAIRLTDLTGGSFISCGIESNYQEGVYVYGSHANGNMFSNCWFELNSRTSGESHVKLTGAADHRSLNNVFDYCVAYDAPPAHDVGTGFVFELDYTEEAIISHPDIVSFSYFSVTANTYNCTLKTDDYDMRSITGNHQNGIRIIHEGSMQEEQCTTNDATPSIGSGRTFYTLSGNAPTTLTDFDNIPRRAFFVVEFADSHYTVDFSGTDLKGNNGVDWEPEDGDYMVCYAHGGDALIYCEVHSGVGINGATNQDIGVAVATSLELGHATDTTWVRSSAGRSTIEDAHLTYTDTVELSSANVLDLADTPITLVAAQGADTVIEFVSAILTHDYGTAAYAEPSAPDDLVIEYATGQDVSASIDSTNFLTVTNDETRWIPKDTTAFPITTDMVALKNSALRLFNTGGDLTTGDGPMTVHITYRVHTLGL